MRFIFILALTLGINYPAAFSQDKPEDGPRVFVTDSQSWETHAAAGGSGGNWGASSQGGARPQTAEIIKTFGERCPTVKVNNIEAKADYIVELDHEGGKGYLRHRNKVAVFEHASGDVIISKSTLSLGGSVQEACEAIQKHWSANEAKMRAATSNQGAPSTPANSTPAPPPAPELTKAATIKIAVASQPDGADIEIDAAFVGNTPSTVEATPGEHSVVVRKKGFKTWERKLKVNGGDIRLNAELEPDK
ncbi:PEGA domain protein [Candidatus Koribacter versatilis Ellin345]|uniref:PEGA domain protein n=1 Tax=Koribacter versatilis (strain Ellin345) TaxID=204669 RepID=Q1IVL6_KORVE|nr:PEGA domain-containing protein [Candidatus Koribacter versatilis]ABF39084.1 PEGA domain protein [Candidatus Koribacter versatilis Ellin345]